MALYQLFGLPHEIWFFDVSSGLEQVSQGCGDHVDHGREGCDVATSASTGPGGLEQAGSSQYALECQRARDRKGRFAPLRDGLRPSLTLTARAGVVRKSGREDGRSPVER